ncbi:MAG: papain-like cysteine protease family protein [Lachnospiraceae bacterium]|nr:papain-like cysteine protease family protein [Lachnospiraceae bacterium]
MVKEAEQKTQSRRVRVRRKRKKKHVILRRLFLFFVVLVLFMHLRNQITERQLESGQSDPVSETLHTMVDSLENHTPNWLDASYPDSIRKLYKNNPEARKYVKDFQEEKDKDHDKNISGEVKRGKIPLFLQWDERWGYEQYGSDYLAVTGCGPTCLSMVYCGLSGSTAKNPYAVAKMAESNGFYVEGSGSSWSLMTDGAALLGLSSHEVPFSEEQIRAELEEGHPIIAVVGPGDFTTEGHFIVLTGCYEDGSIIVHDPNSRKRSKKHWELSTLMEQIQDLWAFTFTE